MQPQPSRAIRVHGWTPDNDHQSRKDTQMIATVRKASVQLGTLVDGKVVATLHDDAAISEYLDEMQSDGWRADDEGDRIVLSKWETKGRMGARSSTCHYQTITKG